MSRRAGAPTRGAGAAGRSFGRRPPEEVQHYSRLSTFHQGRAERQAGSRYIRRSLYGAGRRELIYSEVLVRCM